MLVRRNLALTVSPAAGASNLRLETNITLPVRKGSPIIGSLIGRGGTGPYTYSLTSPPAWLTITSSTGVLNGTPTAVGLVSVIATVTDSATPTPATYTMVFTINVVSKMTATAATLLPMEEGCAYSYAVAASGFTTSLTWTLLNGALPGGITLTSTANTGVLAGTLAANSGGGPGSTGGLGYTFTLRGTDASGDVIDLPFYMLVASPLTWTNTISTSVPVTLGTNYPNLIASIYGYPIGQGYNTANLAFGVIANTGVPPFRITNLSRISSSVANGMDWIKITNAGVAYGKPDRLVPLVPQAGIQYDVVDACGAVVHAPGVGLYVVGPNTAIQMQDSTSGVGLQGPQTQNFGAAFNVTSDSLTATVDGDPAWPGTQGYFNSIGSFGTSPNAAGASTSGSMLTLQPASTSFPGGVSTVAQTFAGMKTFANGIQSNANVTITAGGLTINAGGFNVTGGSLVTGNLNTTNVFSNTAAVAFPGALAGAWSSLYCGAATGATIYGFGTTNDVSLMNRTGNVVLGITANTLNATFAGAVAATGAVTGSNLSGTNTGNVSLAALGSSPNANGMTLVGQVLNLEAASVSFPGAVSIVAQTFAGVKAFNNGFTFAAASSGTANFTVAGAAGTLIAGNMLKAANGWADATVAAQGNGSYFGWNRIAGTAETDFVNYHSAGAGGFYFFDTPDGVTFTYIARITPTIAQFGDATHAVLGQFYGPNGTLWEWNSTVGGGVLLDGGTTADTRILFRNGNGSPTSALSLNFTNAYDAAGTLTFQKRTTANGFVQNIMGISLTGPTIWIGAGGAGTQNGLLNVKGELQSQTFGCVNTSQTASTAATTVNWPAGFVQTVTLVTAVNTTFTFTSPPNPCILMLKLIAPASGTTPTITWPATVKGAPPVTVTLAKTSVLEFFFDGTNYFFMSSCQNV